MLKLILTLQFFRTNKNLGKREFNSQLVGVKKTSMIMTNGSSTEWLHRAR